MTQTTFFKDEFDKRWKTCATCGVVDGQDKHNYVFDGKCEKCREASENDFDFREAKENGKVTCTDSIMCPYCGHVKKYDCYEYNQNSSYTCDECNKSSDLNVEYSVHYTTSVVKIK